jgi:hypothetical protein
MAALSLFSLSALIAGVTCLILEIPTAGVPLILVGAIAPIGLLERNCHPSAGHNLTRRRSQPPSSQSTESDHFALPITGAPKEYIPAQNKEVCFTSNQDG